MSDCVASNTCRGLPAASDTLMTAADEIRFTAPDGTQWSVHEIRSNSSSDHARRSLIFVSDEGFRRVYQYPETWRELSPEELYKLSWGT